MEKQFIIPESLLSDVMTYLQTRPYKEVAQGIAMLGNLPEMEARPGEDAASRAKQVDDKT